MDADPTVVERIRRVRNDLAPAERRVVETLLAHYPMAGLGSIAQLAAAARTSGPTVLRLLGKLGFDGYPAFRERLRGEVGADRRDGRAGPRPRPRRAGDRALRRRAPAAAAEDPLGRGRAHPHQPALPGGVRRRVRRLAAGPQGLRDQPLPDGRGEWDLDTVSAWEHREYFAQY